MANPADQHDESKPKQGFFLNALAFLADTLAVDDGCSSFMAVLAAVAQVVAVLCCQQFCYW